MVKLNIRLLAFFCLIFSIKIQSQNLPPWRYKITDRSHNILIRLNIQIRVGDTTIQKGDFIGVFYDSSGVLACAGYSEWTAEGNINVTAFGDDPLTSEKDGLSLNEVFKWKIWSSSEGREYLARAEYDKSLPNILQDSLFVINGQSALLSLTALRESGPWFYRKTPFKHYIKIPLDAQIYMKNDNLENGDYIGVFYDSSGILACAGYAMWTGRGTVTLTAYGDDPQTNFKEGFIINEKFNWKIYKIRKKKEYLAIAEYDLSLDPQTNRRKYPNDSLFIINGLSGIKSLEIIDLPRTYNLEIEIKKIEFGDPLDPKNYRLIGLPGESSVLIERCINGIPIQDWIAFYDDGKNRLVGYNIKEKNKFAFGFGRAFWLLSKYRFYFKDTVTAAKLDANYNYYLKLNKGWNIITNPFDYEIDWNVVRSINNIDEPIWEYNNGIYRKPSKMQVYRGYYFYNKKNLSSLRLPYPIQRLLVRNPAVKTNNLENEERDSIIRVYFEVDKENDLSFQTEISLTKKLTKEEVIYRDLTPFPQFFLVGGGFVNTEENNFYNKAEIPTKFKVISLPIRLYSSQTTVFFKVNINSAIKDFFKDYSVYLLDENQKSYILVDENRTYSLEFAKSNSKNLILILANKTEFEENNIDKNFFANDFCISDFYPNPFNSSTQAKVFVPYSGKIEYEIYNILGQRIYENYLFVGNRGWLELQLRDSNFAGSGIYFVQIKFENTVRILKLSYIK